MTFAALQGDELGGPHWADLLLFGAVAAAAIGYAEGGMLARELGAWQTISSALLAGSPVMVAITVLSIASRTPARTGMTGSPSAISRSSACSSPSSRGTAAW